MSSLVLVAALISSANPHGSCQTPMSVIEGAAVRDAPADPTALDLTFEGQGFNVQEHVSVSWPACPVRLQQKVYGGWAFTDTGVPIRPNAGKLATRTDISSSDPEPAHPELSGGVFSGSADLVSGGKRVGLWTRRDGTSLIGYYVPGQKDAPHLLLRSAKPVLGLGYLPAPDSAGGLLSLWQDVGPAQYRFISLSWSEAGLR